MYLKYKKYYLLTLTIIKSINTDNSIDVTPAW